VQAVVWAQELALGQEVVWVDEWEQELASVVGLAEVSQQEQKSLLESRRKRVLRLRFSLAASLGMWEQLVCLSGYWLLSLGQGSQRVVGRVLPQHCHMYIRREPQ